MAESCGLASMPAYGRQSREAVYSTSSAIHLFYLVKSISFSSLSFSFLSTFIVQSISFISYISHYVPSYTFTVPFLLICYSAITVILREKLLSERTTSDAAMQRREM
jgi:hypothetical protein